MAFPTSDGSPNKSWFSPKSDGFLQQVVVVPTSYSSPFNKWWFSPTNGGFLQQMVVFTNK
jgi:hypothetical protein